MRNNRFSHLVSSILVRYAQQGFSSLVSDYMERSSVSPLNLQGAKFYQMDDGRWLILDYLNIPDAPRHYIDCIEGDICNMNVRIISDATKKEIEKNQEIFEEEYQ